MCNPAKAFHHIKAIDEDRCGIIRVLPNANICISFFGSQRALVG
jgi:hypothetical protein